MRRNLYLPAILVVAIAAGCSADPAASRDEHLKRGDQFLSEQRLREAVLEYKSAVAADAFSPDAHLKLAEGYLALNDVRNAAYEFVQTADLLPDDVPVQLRAARALVNAGRFEDARGRVAKVLDRDPRNVEALIIEGNALAGMKDLSGAIDRVQSAVRLNPDYTTGYTMMGALQLVQGNPKEAEASFKRAVTSAPDSVPARLALANLFWSTGREREAETTLREALALEPNSVIANRALYLMLMNSRRIAEAEAPLKIIAAHSTTAEGRIALADYYAASQRLKEASAIYEDVEKDPLFGATAKLRMASLGLISGDRAAAYRLVDEVLESDPRHVEALVGKAQLLLGDGKRDEALTTARAAVAAGPDNATAHYVEGLVLVTNRQPDEATAAFQEALKADFGFAPANFELARLALAAGRYQDAIEYARSAIQVIPGYGEAHLIVARAEMLRGNPAGAEEPLRLLVANFPDVPGVQAEVGRLLLMKKDAAGARRAFERALNKDAQQAEAIQGLTVLDVGQNRSAAARARLDGAMAEASNNALLLVIGAQLYATSFNDLDAAERTARQALAADASNLEAYGLLARIHVQQQNLPAATTEFQKLADLQPRSVANRTAVGMLHQLQNQLDDAKASYERALAIDPRAPVAANNLAQLYVDRNENLDVALQLAQTAKAGLPNSHEVDDTLGWIYYRKGMALQSIAALRQAVAVQPDNAMYLYHLGAAYALNNDKTNARQTLEKALRVQPSFAGAADARRILNSLN